jgi:6-phosphofructokinase 1
VPLDLDGFLPHLRDRVARGHALVVVAEGAGQDYLSPGNGTDASGNRRLADFGVHLRSRILDDFAAAGVETNLKYIDPSYVIRSVPANPYDSVYCLRLAQAAVHAAMAGRTEMVVGSWRNRFVHVPIPLAVASRNQVDPDGDLWMSVLEATGQPPSFAAASDRSPKPSLV